MKKYEYEIWTRTMDKKSLSIFLNEQGELGWQLVYHDDGHTFIFMREMVI